MSKVRVRYPLKFDDQRTLSPDYSGPVFVWDIDKTYLNTPFSTVKGMARIPVEFAIDKKAVPGMPEILRGLRRGHGDEIKCQPLYFVSASPVQLRPIIERKMLLDGVEYDGIIFKDWLKVLKSMKPSRLTEQVGFKVFALLLGRLHRPHAIEYLFGDDAESDPDSFSFYADLISGQYRERRAKRILTELGVAVYDQDLIMDLWQQIPKGGRVERIFIHQVNESPVARPHNPLVSMVQDSSELVAMLRKDCLVDDMAVEQVARVVSEDRSREIKT